MHQAAGAQGAHRTGLSRLIELNSISAAGDALLAIALAGTLFFTVPTEQARGDIALYLLLTMAPFAVIAPVVGPFLDRFRHGRRWAIGITMAVRAFLSWVLADAVLSDAVWLYPAALGCLVASRAFGVTRAAAIPRLLPEGVALVTANSRIGLAGAIGAAVAAPIGVGLATFGADWVLRMCFVVYAAGAVVAILLPGRVDSSVGEVQAGFGGGRSRRRTVSLPASVVRALRANAALRWFSGFLTMFLAFVLRAEPVGGLNAVFAIGLTAAAAWLGTTTGTSVGALLRARNPDRTIMVLVSGTILVATLTAVWWHLVTALLVAAAVGFGQQLGRLSLDAIVQRDVPERVRASAFARSDTLLQVTWVLGGGIGIVLPLVPALGLGVAAAVMALGLYTALRIRLAPTDSGRA